MAVKLQLCSLSPADLKAKFLRYLLSVEANLLKNKIKFIWNVCYYSAQPWYCFNPDYNYLRLNLQIKISKNFCLQDINIPFCFSFLVSVQHVLQGLVDDLRGNYWYTKCIWEINSLICTVSGYLMAVHCPLYRLSGAEATAFLASSRIMTELTARVQGRLNN